MLTSVYNALYGQMPVRRGGNTRLSGPTELRELCSRIAKKNSLSPIYLLRVDESKKNFLINMKEDALTLSSLLADLDPEQSDLYQAYRAVSDHPGLATAELTPEGSATLKQAIATQDPGKQPVLPRPVTLRIHHLATSQRNVGSIVYPDSHILEPGLYRFQADVEEDLYQFQFNVTREHTNQDILNSLASFLERSRIGIHANVETLENGRIRMCLESDAVGNVNLVNFSLEDIEYPYGSHGLVDYFGLNHTEEFPTNASFTLNGSEKELVGNDFTLSKSLHISLLDVSSEEIRISYAPDTENVLAHLNTFMDQYNSFLQAGEEAIENRSGSSTLHRNLSRVLSRHTSKLEHCGIQLAEGKLTVNEEDLQTALESGAIKRLFASDSPFVRDLKKEINQILLDPVQYATKKIVSYPNTSRQNFIGPYGTALYSGLFYNKYL